MGRPLPPRVIRSGRYLPTSVRSGDVTGSIFRKKNLITRGRGSNFYEEVFSGLEDINEPPALVSLTGTLTFTANSTNIAGVGTIFFTECHLGQFICAFSSDGLSSWLLVVRRIISDTSMEVWKAPDTSLTGAIGWQMSVLFAMNDQRGVALRGNAIKLDKGSILSVGSGTLYVNGDPLAGSSLTMTRAPKLSLFNATAETYTNFTLGMNTPTGITAAAVAGGTKGMQAGIYSLVVQAARKETGGYNLASLKATVTIATNDKVRVTLPAMDTAAGQNAWRISVTTFQATLGSELNYLEGPWFFYQPAGAPVNCTCTDADVSSAGGTFDIEWLDAEVERNDTVDFTVPDDPPTDAEFVALLNNIPVWISCQGQGNTTNPTMTSPGPFICPAKPGNVEAAPLQIAFSSSPPETILGVVSAQGRLYLLTINHLQIAQATPDDFVPILIRPFWKDGFANPYQLVFVNGNLYGFPVAGPSRSVGDGDEIEAERDWAEDVAEIVLGNGSTGSGWNPGQVLVGYDPFNDGVVFFHAADRLNDAGWWTTRWLMFGISQGFWIGDGEFSSDTEDQIVSGVATISDRLEIIIGGRGGETPLEQVAAEAQMSLPAMQWSASVTTAANEVSAEASWTIP